MGVVGVAVGGAGETAVDPHEDVHARVGVQDHPVEPEPGRCRISCSLRNWNSLRSWPITPSSAGTPLPGLPQAAAGEHRGDRAGAVEADPAAVVAEGLDANAGDPGLRIATAVDVGSLRPASRGSGPPGVAPTRRGGSGGRSAVAGGCERRVVDDLGRPMWRRSRLRKARGGPERAAPADRSEQRRRTGANSPIPAGAIGIHNALRAR
jgi:hypothetical protein